MLPNNDNDKSVAKAESPEISVAEAERNANRATWAADCAAVNPMISANDKRAIAVEAYASVAILQESRRANNKMPAIKKIDLELPWEGENSVMRDGYQKAGAPLPPLYSKEGRNAGASLPPPYEEHEGSDASLPAYEGHEGLDASLPAYEGHVEWKADAKREIGWCCFQ